MTSSTFPDVNVWLALLMEHHVHRAAARRWLESTESGPIGFLRVTQLSVLRLLTTAGAMNGKPLRMAQAWAAYDANVASYRQNVLTAFQEVEDNLAGLRILDQESTKQDQAVRSAELSLALSTTRYKGGLVTYLEVITAQSTALSNERTAVDILTRRMNSTVLLIKALGGGWDVSKLPQLTGQGQAKPAVGKRVRG